MNSNEIRKRFLCFFEDKGHTVVPSDLLVPRNDPTLLFTGAGMNQFKEQFMGKNITFRRAVSCQKCLRTADVFKVGDTPRHHTFFEMLGNFSFGDYFKKEAIQWAWEFMTREMNLPGERLWVSVYEEDEESYSIWLDEIKVPAERIIKLGPEDNFWPANAPLEGPNGPCGPCSEIFYDWGGDTGCGKESCSPACECGRFVEIWNLVFTEFNRNSDGTLSALPNKNIDTGMGLERIVSVMQSVRTNFETDIFASIVKRIKKTRPETAGRISDVYLVADHVRAAAFAIADGVSPSNEKRGYVIRKLIRRAYLKGGRKGPFLYNLVPEVARSMKDVYPELEEKKEHISAIIREEECKFSDTLKTALPVLDDMVSGGSKTLDGEKIFKLVDTYGLPFDVITEEAGKKGVSLDMEGFERFMAERKEQSRKGSDMSGEMIFQPDHFSSAPRPSYSDDLPLEASIEFILKEEGVSDRIGEGEQAEIITSPQSAAFYAESGGQVGDTGSIVKPGGRMDIRNTFEADGRKVFQVIGRESVFEKGDRVTLDLNGEKKKRTAANHTATHLLQAALRQVLGEHVKQSGSFVDGGKLRFDFTHMKKLSARELAKVEMMVNNWIGEKISVNKDTKTLEDAKKEGALSFFGEKYGDTVRVVSIGNESRELCGGSHVENTADIKIMKIVSESSVASGIRRIEAVTGENAENWLKKTLRGMLDGLVRTDTGGEPVLDKEIERYADDIINDRTEITPDVMRDFDERINPAFLKAREQMEKTAKKRQKEEQTGRFNAARKKIDEIAGRPVAIGNINFVSGILEGLDMSLLRKAVSHIEKQVNSAVILLGGSKDGKANLICVVTPDLAGGAVNARAIISEIAPGIAGSGGGKAEFAQAGGKNPEGMPDALKKAAGIIAEQVKGD